MTCRHRPEIVSADTYEALWGDTPVETTHEVVCFKCDTTFALTHDARPIDPLLIQPARIGGREET